MSVDTNPNAYLKPTILGEEAEDSFLFAVMS